MDFHQAFYLINESPASSTSTLVLRTPGINIDTGDASAGVDQDSSVYFAPTIPSSPYMRSPRLSSPQALPSQDNVHECPPDSSSPLVSYSSSSCSSPYFPVAGHTGGLSGTSSLSSDDLNHYLADSGILDESDVFSSGCTKYEMDEFSRRLYERLLVVARERENVEENLDNANASARSLGGQSYASSRSASGISNASVSSGGPKKASVSGNTNMNLLFAFEQPSNAHEDGLDVEDSSLESDLDTPFFASPPLSENITPPRFRKRFRATNGDHSTVLNQATSSQPSTQIAEDKGAENDFQPQYRIIWSAESFQAVQGQCLTQEEWEKDAPPLKRKKANSYSHRQQFALKPASVRRAASLKSAYEFATRSTSFDDVNQELIPTEPATPVPSSHNSKRSFFIYGVPIIAPPPDHVAGLPISEETVAKIRLQRFLEREFASRQADGLGIPDICRQESDLIMVRQRDHNHILGSSQKDLWEEFLTIGQYSREDVVDWLLNVLPSEDHSQSSFRSSFSSSTSQGSSSDTHHANLYEELSNSPETRFHAVYVFLRFFYRVMSRESDMEQVTLSDGTTLLRRIDGKNHVPASIDEEGKKLLVWDIAVGSLTLSVKFHRDFLEPLSPIFAREYQQLAPHRLSFGDLESAQRDILIALSHHLGVTPQPLFDNLWLALPALRQLFDYEGGWNYVLKETWLQLFDAVSEPDVLQFPLSLLTMACLVEGILAALVHKHDFSLKWRKSVLQTKKNITKIKRKRTVKRIEERAEGVIHDIQAVIAITDARLNECRLWLADIHGGRN